jgi:hypothetical protein
LLFGAFVFPLEILAALLAYFARESVGATILSIIAFSWLGTAVVTYASAPDATYRSLEQSRETRTPSTDEPEPAGADLPLLASTEAQAEGIAPSA